MASPRSPLRHIAMMKHVMMKRWKSKNPKSKKISPPPPPPPPPLLDSEPVSPAESLYSSFPSGFFPVYVGPSHTRFLIPTRFLNLTIIKNLLREAEEEYGFDFPGGIVLPCQVVFFEEMLRFVQEDERKYGSLEVNEFVKMISDVGLDSFSCKESEQFFSFRSNLSLGAISW